MRNSVWKDNPVTVTLIAIQVIIYLLMTLAGGSTNPAVLLRFGALQSAALQAGEWWRLITPVFVHIGFAHLLINSITLYFIGMYIEQLFGHCSGRKPDECLLAASRNFGRCKYRDFRVVWCLHHVRGQFPGKSGVANAESAVFDSGSPEYRDRFDGTGDRPCGSPRRLYRWFPTGLPGRGTPLRTGERHRTDVSYPGLGGWYPGPVYKSELIKWQVYRVNTGHYTMSSSY